MKLSPELGSCSQQPLQLLEVRLPAQSPQSPQNGGSHSSAPRGPAPLVDISHLSSAVPGYRGRDSLQLFTMYFVGK